LFNWTSISPFEFFVGKITYLVLRGYQKYLKDLWAKLLVYNGSYL